MIHESLDQLSSSKFRAVIINHNTKLVTTLALLSTLKHAGMPTLLVDCESSDGSLDHFLNLQKHQDFDIIKLPLQAHGSTLDYLFTNVPSDYILAVDSDLEILGTEIIEFMKRHIEHVRVFGAGFMNAPYTMTDDMFRETDHYEGLLMERAWMPLVLFKSATIRTALRAGYSFNAESMDNELTSSSFLSKGKRTLIGRVILKIFKHRPKSLRRRYYDFLKPGKVVYDTGSKLYHYLRFKEQMHFVSLPEPVSEVYTRHFTGSTRHYINENDPTASGHSPDEVKAILLNKYDLEIHE